jgi:hypothetical protein
MESDPNHSIIKHKKIGILTEHPNYRLEINSGGFSDCFSPLKGSLQLCKEDTVGGKMK